MITYIQLFFEFFKTGLFAVGGGLATLPFLSDIANRYPWFGQDMLANMVAVSQSTPGPIGINMATYAGFEAKAFLGSVISTTALVLPSFMIILIVARFLQKFRESKVINNIFIVLRPVVTGLITIAWFDIMKISLTTGEKLFLSERILNSFKYEVLVVFIILFVIHKKYNKHPIFYIGIGAIVGIIFRF